MIRKLPGWLMFGGVLLTFSAGLVNAVALLSFANQAVTHVTGSVTIASTALARGHWGILVNLALVVLFFFLGAVLSGLITRGRKFKLGRRYGFALALESLLLLITMMLFRHSSLWGQLSASMACGLQNAMVSTFSCAVIRTTHMTGMVTDMGAEIGHWIRGNTMDTRRFVLYLMLFTSFFTGGVVGTLSFDWLGFETLIIPALITCVSSVIYTYHVVQRRKVSGDLSLN